MKHKVVHHKAKHAVRHVTHSPHHDTKIAKALKVFLVACIAAMTIVLLILAYLTFVTERSTKVLDEHTKAIDALLQSATLSPKPSTVSSTLGFSLNYDSSQFTAVARLSDSESSSTYSDEELATPRAYTDLEVSTRVDDYFISAQLSPPKVALSIRSNISDNYWASALTSPVYAGLSKLDILTQLQSAVKLSQDGVEASSPEDVSIAGIPYKKIIYTKKSQIFGKVYSTQEITYLAVQNDRPYVVTISPITAENRADIGLYEVIIENITYTAVSSDSASILDSSSGRVAGVATSSDLPSVTTKTPYKIKPSTIIDIILRNQPAVVRVATAYCSNIELLLPDGSVGLQLDNACAAFIGSGSFISSDGYIATNGHVATIVPANAVSGYSLLTESKEKSIERITKVLKYMVAANLATDADVSTLLSEASRDDPKALGIISTLGNYIPEQMIRPSDEKLSYAIQLSSDPIQYSVDKSAFTYTDTVIAAQLVSKNFDNSQKVAGTYAFGTGNFSDVALLKAKGVFPVISLGSTSRLEVGDDLTAIGFPAYTDGGLMTKRSNTPPTVTQGSIQKIENEETSGLTLIYTNIPIAQGYSGGPAFSDTGRQIGLNTYSLLECQDQECFGDGVARDIADLKTLLTENNVTLNVKSDINKRWQQGLEAYSDGNYRGAVRIFESVSEMYPAHYLADSISKVAVSKYGSPSDTSDGLFTSYGFAQVAKILGLIVLIGGAGLVVFLVHGSRKHGLAAHYRTGEPAPIPDYQQGQAVQITPVMQSPETHRPEEPEGLQSPNLAQVNKPEESNSDDGSSIH